LLWNPIRKAMNLWNNHVWTNRHYTSIRLINPSPLMGWFNGRGDPSHLWTSEGQRDGPRLNKQCRTSWSAGVADICLIDGSIECFGYHSPIFTVSEFCGPVVTRRETKVQPHSRKGNGADHPRLSSFKLVSSPLAQKELIFSRMNNPTQKNIHPHFLPWRWLRYTPIHISDMCLGSYHPNGPFLTANHACRSSGAEIRSCPVPVAI
jgi:hypothetical protein